MEDFIVHRKIMEMEKDKIFFFKIPLLFDVKYTEFIFEFTENKFKKDMIVEFHIRGMQNTLTTQTVIVPININPPKTTVSLKENRSLLQNDYLLLACMSNHPFQLALSIKRL